MQGTDFEVFGSIICPECAMMAFPKLNGTMLGSRLLNMTAPNGAKLIVYLAEASGPKPRYIVTDITQLSFVLLPYSVLSKIMQAL